jgi:Fe(3+) dicitrate transport protein
MKIRTLARCSTQFRLVLAALAGLGGFSPAQSIPSQPAAGSAQPSWETMPAVTVIGSAAAVRDLAGAGAYLDRAVLDEQNYTNPNRVLARVPGVYLREEDGSGNFPNVSLRGVDSSRSSKVTLMEDGILTAPAPYSAPAAYYFPRIARMSAVEVLKGSSQVRFGPHTTGGVINFVSTPVPESASGLAKITYGNDNTWLGHFHHGDLVETKAGKIGWVLELFGQASDGFREIENGAGYGGSDETGFQTIEPMLKLSWEPAGGPPQGFEFKIGYTDFDADETYLGLGENDVRSRPNLRYASTRFDNIASEHFRTYLRHRIEASDNVRFDSAVYYNRFERDWFKLDSLTRPDGTKTGLSKALLSASDLAILRGRAGGSLNVRHNDRVYESYGAQTTSTITFQTGGLEHTLDLGLRLHYDSSARDQFEEIFTQDTSGRIVKKGRTAPHSAGWREEEATALALFAEDSIRVGDFTIKPGIRYERIEYSYTDFLTGEGGEKSLDVFAPGLGVTWDAIDDLTLFAGVYRGFSVPEPMGYVRDGLTEETSTGYELGARWSNDAAAFGVELVGFYTRFQDLLVINNIGSTGTGGSENVGEVDSAGIEFSVSWDPLAARGNSVTLPMHLGLTYTDATFGSGAASDDAASIFANAQPGNQVPYIPEWAMSAGIGLRGEKWGVSFDMTYVSEMFTSADNVDAPTTDARFGMTDEALIFDLSAHYKVRENIRLLAGVSNLFDEEYISSRVPQGPRTGAPRQFHVGVECTW